MELGYNQVVIRMGVSSVRHTKQRNLVSRGRASLLPLQWQTPEEIEKALTMPPDDGDLNDCSPTL